MKLLLTLPVYFFYALVWDEFPHGVYDLTTLRSDALVCGDFFLWAQPSL